MYLLGSGMYLYKKQRLCVGIVSFGGRGVLTFVEYRILLGSALLPERSHGLTLILQENSRSLWKSSFVETARCEQNESNEK